MGKIGKARRKKEKLAKKRAMKAANRARYEELRRLGQNKKSKRFRKHNKKRLANTISHPEGVCGNIGCQKCDPCNLYKAA